MDVNIIDINFFTNEAIGSFLIETDSSPVLFETGPYTCHQSLKAGITALGYEVSDIKHVFVTHIHLDHSGGAWAFAEQGATIYVHPVGVPHLVDPEKLMKSATRIYGDKMDELWGEVRGIDQSKVVAISDNDVIRVGDLEIKAIETSGHAWHHHCYLVDNCLFTGDIAGCRVPGGPVVPATPPPEIHVEQWKDSVKKIREISPDKLYLTHFGEYSDVNDLLDELVQNLDDWTQWVGNRVSAGKPDKEINEEFAEYSKELFKKRGTSEETVSKYEITASHSMNLSGLIRYWRKHRLSDS